MTPRPGGETDKFGNRYEGAWTIRHALYVLSGMGASITLEPSSLLGDGVEFCYRNDGGIQVHQVKRQNGNANSWNVASLRDKGVWSNLRSHVDSDRAFHFVSLVPARTLDELADRARRSDTFAHFQSEWLDEGLQGAFDALAAADVFGSAARAWRMLRGLWVEWPDERDLVHTNAVMAAQVLAGAPGRLAALGLGDLLLNSLGTTLDAPAINARLREYGLRRVMRVDVDEVSGAVRDVTRRWAATVERGLLRPVIRREATDQLVEQVRSDERQIIVVTGAAGGGKSAVLHQVLDVLTDLDTAVLAFRLDRLEPFTSTHELGLRTGLTMSPVSALGAAAHGHPCVLIVDQLDAVSLASGRIPDTFDAVADLMDEALTHPAMRVVLVCRAFDATADPRIRQLTASNRCVHISVEPLSDAQVDTALAGMGRAASRMTPSQRGLLRSPLHLALLTQVADREETLSFRTIRQLFDDFWDTKRQDCTRRQSSVRFHEAVSAVVDAMSARQTLYVPDSVLDSDDLAMSADVLVSEHILVRDGRKLAFFHEGFFDYAFARDWLRRDESLVTFLTGGEQELFRRGQVRQVLDHLRAQDPERFTEEVEALLTSPEVRYHVKDVTLAVLRGLEAPSPGEWETIERVLQTRPVFQTQLVSAISSPEWFRRADDEAALDDWLVSADEREHEWAVRMMTAGAFEYPDRVARLMGPHAADPRFGSWLERIVRFADLAGARRLFDLVLEGARTGILARREHLIWISVHDLADRRPVWAVELIGALLLDRPDALRLEEDGGRVAVLLTRDHDAVQVVSAAALGAPEDFCVRVLPLLLGVMAAAALPPRAGCPVYDRHFTFRSPDDQPSTLGDALFEGTAASLRLLAGQDPVRARDLVAGLASVPYEAAQWLLYQVLIGAGPALAPYSAEVLLQGRHRLLSGYMSNTVWGAREVLRATGEALPDNTLARMERMLLHLRLPPDDELSPWHEFTLLTALPERRLSERAVRRLGELRRRFESREPDEPQGTTGGFVGPPISSEAAQHMSDDQWLGAMRKHSQDRTDWTTFTGGARELSHVLRNMTAAGPGRFSRLAVRVDAAMHPAYGASLLQGLGDAEAHGAPETVFAAIRHLADRASPAHDRWLGWAMRRYLPSVPLDLVATLLERALGFDYAGDSVDEGEGDVEAEADAERDLLTAGINTVRGSAVESLGDLLIHAADGSRAALVVPHLGRLAADPSLPVRACAARLLHAAMRYDRPAIARAFTALVQAPDQLLASPHVVRLFVALCHGAPATGRPVMERMLCSPVAAVRRIGGQVAALAAMEWETPDLLAKVLACDDGAQREGAADVCAYRLRNTGDTALAHHALVRFFHDPEEDVREAAAAVAAALRGQRLRPFRPTVTALIESDAFAPALPQLLLALDEAPDRVDELVLACVRRFLALFGAASADLATRAAADAHHVGELLVRAHAQASPARRSEFLDLLDELLLHGAYGVAEAVGSADRG